MRRNESEGFVRIPMDEADTFLAERIAALPCLLSDLGVEVSAARVVDSREREHLLRTNLEPGTVPLIYPWNLRNSKIAWPDFGVRWHALVANQETASLLLPNETYVLVKRDTAERERRRVVAAISSPDDLPGEHVGFVDHLNVYHSGGRGLDRPLALGLVAFLNTTLVDAYVRRFSGHTQIFAGDLRHLRYPNLFDLRWVGEKIATEELPKSQSKLDGLVAIGVAAFHPDEHKQTEDVVKVWGNIHLALRRAHEVRGDDSIPPIPPIFILAASYYSTDDEKAKAWDDLRRWADRYGFTADTRLSKPLWLYGGGY